MSSVQTLGRCGVALFFAALASGCSMVGPGGSDGGGECRWNPSKCMYEGSYEPGERDYAEDEAARLNRAASRNIRRSGD